MRLSRHCCWERRSRRVLRGGLSTACSAPGNGVSMVRARPSRVVLCTPRGTLLSSSRLVGPKRTRSGLTVEAAIVRPSRNGVGRGGPAALKQTCPRSKPRAQFAFKHSMIHGILQFTLRIAFRCVLHRCKSQDIRC